MIKSVHIPIFLEISQATEGQLLALKTIRVGFPTLPLFVWWMGGNNTLHPDFLAANAESRCPGNIFFDRRTNDGLIKHLSEVESESFAVIDSDVVFYENCEDFEPTRLIAGEFIPEFICPIARAVTRSRLHTAFFVVSDPVKLRREIKLDYMPPLPKFCPFDPFSPVTTFLDGTPYFHDSCSVLYHAIGGQHFDAGMLKRFEHLHGGSYAPEGPHRDRIKAAYENPESARGTREMMTKYFADRKP